MKQLLSILLFINSFSILSQDITADTTLANRYFKMGDSLLLKYTDNEKAKEYFTKAASLYLNHKLWNKHFRSLSKIATIMALKEKEPSIRLADSIATESINILEKNNAEEAFAYMVIGNSYLNNKNSLQDYKLSLEHFNKAIQIQENLAKKPINDLIDSYQARGLVSFKMGRLQESLDDNLKAINFLNKLYPGSHVKKTYAYNNIGASYWRLGSLDLAIEYYKKTVRMVKEVFGKKSPHLKTIYSNIGLVYSSQEKYNKAFENYFTSFSFYTKKELTNSKDLAFLFSRIATTHNNNNNEDSCIFYNRKALKIANTQRPFYKNMLETSIYRNLGLVHLKRNNSDSALFYYQKEGKRRIKPNYRKHHLVANYYNRLATAYESKDSLKLALQYFQHAFYANIKNFSDTTNIYVNPSINNYFDIRVLLNSLHLKANTLFKLYKKNHSEKDLMFSLETYKLCNLLIEKIRSSHLKSSDKIALGKKSVEIYKNSLKANVAFYKLAQGDIIKMPSETLNQVFNISERSKSSVLYSAISESKAKKFSKIPDSLLLKEKEFKIERDYFKKQLRRKLDSAKTVALNDKLFAVNRSYDSLIATFESNYPDYYNLKHNTRINSIREIQRSLESKTSLIEYFIGDSTLYTFVINKNSFHLEETNFKSSLSNQIRDLISYAKSEDISHFTKAAFELYQLLIYPIEKKIEGNRLIIIPDGELWHLSFDILIQNLPQSEYWNKLDYLINKYSFSYAYSASLLLQEKTRIINSPKKECLAFSFSKNDNTNLSNQLAMRNFRNSNLIDLPGSRKEIAAVSKFIDGIYYYGGMASEKNFKDKAGEYAILHLALHGTVDDKNPMNSRLYFSQRNEDNNEIIQKDSLNNSKTRGGNSLNEFQILNETKEDNYLHAYELYNLNLNAEMVVLSACNTGSGKLEKGEGVMSLGRAFTYAGCKSLVISQWKLSDYSTPIIIENFYKNLFDEKPKDVALRESKINYLNKADNLKANPYLWAGLVQVGDYAPLQKSSDIIWFVLGSILFASFIGFMFLEKK